MRAADFIEETATAIAGTNGNGDVTLGQSGTRPRFSHAYPSGAYVRYVIEDTATGKLESGIGYVASNVLTRSKPRTTWDGTTYNNKAPTALAFGSTPAAGKVLVRLAQVSDTSSSGIQSFVTKSIANLDTAWAPFPLSNHLNCWPSAQTYTIANSYDYYSYYKLDTGGSLQGIQIEVTTAQSAGGTLKMALYELGLDGLPGKKILDFPDIDTSTTGAKALTDSSLWTPAENAYLSPGWYVIGMKTPASASLNLRGATNGNSTVQQTTPLGKTASYVGYKNTISRNNNYDNGAMPAVPDFNTGSPSVASTIIWIGLKVAP